MDPKIETVRSHETPQSPKVVLDIEEQKDADVKDTDFKDADVRFDDHSDPSISEKASSSTLTKWQRIKVKFPYWRLLIDTLVGCFFTAWWLSIIIQDKHRHQWLIPTVLWGMLMVRLISWHCRILYVIYHYAAKVWNYFTDIVYERVLTTRPRRLLVGATITVGVILLGTFVPEEIEFSKRQDRAISFCGLVVAVLGLWATSKNRSKIQWNAVIGGILMQYIIGLFVLRTKAGYDIFNFISTLARELLGFAKDGVAFLTNDEVSKLGMFFFTVLPAVAFFVAFVHIFYYYGVIQWFIGKFAKFFFWTLRISGAEAITASASPFIGIGESAILIKDLLPLLTQAELHQVMTSGFGTISGAVLVGYIGLGLNAQVLVSSCIMSIPGSIAVSKLRFPETEVPVSQGTVVFPEETDPNKKPQNVLQSFSEGATLGLFTAATMLIQCMCIIALVALLNGILTWFGNFWNIHELTLDLIFSYIFYPATFFLGVPRNEILNISKLISIKFMQNEYMAYSMLISDAPYNQMSQRGTLIATYALCGFANFGSMGITLGVLNTLSKGKRSSDISREIWSALFSGFIVTMMSAAVAGMVIHDLDGF